jgi:hypothetical protein
MSENNKPHTMSPKRKSKAQEMREMVEQYEERCVAMGQSLPEAELKLMAQTVFPTGTLPDESDPIEFTRRELELFRHLLWMTDETKGRWMRACMERSFRSQGVAT